MSKRFFSMTLALALLIAAPFAIAEEQKASTDSKAPRLTLAEPIKDFGTVPKGTQIEWAFRQALQRAPDKAEDVRVH